MLGKKCNILRGHFIVTGVQCVCCLIYTKETPGMCVLVASFLPINVKEIKREMKASYLSNIWNVFILDKFTFFSRVHFLPLLEWGLLHLRLFALW